jgi:hypothetical protein
MDSSSSPMLLFAGCQQPVRRTRALHSSTRSGRAASPVVPPIANAVEIEPPSKVTCGCERWCRNARPPRSTSAKVRVDRIRCTDRRYWIGSATGSAVMGARASSFSRCSASRAASSLAALVSVGKSCPYCCIASTSTRKPAAYRSTMTGTIDQLRPFVAMRQSTPRWSPPRPLDHVVAVTGDLRRDQW